MRPQSKFSGGAWRIAGCLILSALVLFRAAHPFGQREFGNRVAALEKRTGGQFGIAALDTATGKRLRYRPAQRFAMCSTFKFFLTAAILARADAGKESLDRRISYRAADLLEYAPDTRMHLPEGSMTVSALCAAAIEHSDNTAANLLLKLIGSPQALTMYVRSLQDRVTRFDRYEPYLNSNLPGDIRDTTSPDASLDTMYKLLIGNLLSQNSRLQLQSWMAGCSTGATRLRAGFPSTWRVGDKTGTGNNGATNDIAIAWPPNRRPVLAAVYFTSSKIGDSERNAALAEVAELIASEIVK